MVIVVQTVRMAAGASVSRLCRKRYWWCAACVVGAAVCRVAAADRVHVANLLLMRSAKRQKELAIRVALGASRWQIVRQLLVEGIVLATLAAFRACVRELGNRLLAALGPNILPREVSIDARVFGFMALAVAVISVGFGLVAARPVDLHEALKITRQSGGAFAKVEQRSGCREVSLAVLLLVGSGLLGEELLHLQDESGIVAMS